MAELLNTVAKQYKGIEIDYDIAGISIDSRTIKPGELFVAVKGHRTDGHNYIDQAVRNGASGIVFKEGFKLNPEIASRDNLSLIAVEDTLKFLGDMANWYLKEIDPRVIGVTGTNGKTSVKDFIIKILSEEYPVDGTEGNLNNIYGLPLSIFELNPVIEAAVFEMGISECGELTRLCEIAEPDIGVLNNISPAHLEGLGSLENVIDAKAELIQYLSENGGVAVLNMDDENIAGLSGRCNLKVVTVGSGEDLDYRISEIELNDRGCARFKINESEVHLNIPGIHNVYNAAMAAATAVTYGMEFNRAVKIFPFLKLPEMRTTVYKFVDIIIIDDCYNANPQSVREAMKLLCAIPANRRFMVFGDMLELGDMSEELHREIGKEIGKVQINFLYTYGEMSEFTGEEAAVSGIEIDTRHFKAHNEIARALLSQARPGDAILFKGSRGMKLEIALELFEQQMEIT